MELTTKLLSLTGIGPTLVRKLDILQLYTIDDLIHYYPFRYDDFSKTSAVSEARVGDQVTLKGEIWSIENVYTKSRKIITKAIFNDGTSSITLTWFNSPWLKKTLNSGDTIQVAGKINRFGGKISMIAPKWEKIESLQPSAVSHQAIHTGGLISIYPETYGLTSKWIRTKINQILPQALLKIDDPIPPEITDNYLPLTEALQKIHFPENYQDIVSARNRLSFDELFYIQLSSLKKRADWQKHQSTKALNIDQKNLHGFIEKLPFKLTNAQNKVIKEIISDVTKTHPANRLVQGEVGSGKTVVAAVIMYLTYLNGLRSVLMAPTEILAFQHHATLTKLLEPFGIKVGIYTGSKKAISYEPLAMSNAIVGTHALLSKKLDLDNVGLVVIDEQQRFGVEQRGLLRNKTKSPHFITMTATPIPRTVALTLYGDLDLSVIDEMPIGRIPVKTYFVPEKKRKDAYKFIEKLIKEGQQAYIITPLIDLSETLVSAKAAKEEFELLSKKVFPKLKLGLLHGRLKSKEKEEVINDFKNKKIDILVSTSVVEVGMDISNATIMVIEGSERFGLAQLHQLRGRVGRGSEQSYCLLFTENDQSSTVSRIKNLESIHDGLKLAELDLKIRGSGEIFGTKQHGEMELKIARLNDLKLIEETRQKAQIILQDDLTLDKYPKLKGKLIGLDEIMPD